MILYNVIIFSEILEYKFEQDEKAKAAKAETLFKDTIPFYLRKLDAQVEKNNGYFVGGHVGINLDKTEQLIKY